MRSWHHDAARHRQRCVREPTPHCVGGLRGFEFANVILTSRGGGTGILVSCGLAHQTDKEISLSLSVGYKVRVPFREYGSATRPAHALRDTHRT
jgi:hypothetical protein